MNPFETDLLMISKIWEVSHVVRLPQEQEKWESPDSYEAKVSALASGLKELPSLDYA